MQEGLVHFYNVITGRCACGAPVKAEMKTFTVFPEGVSCGECLKALGHEGKDIRKSEGKSG